MPTIRDVAKAAGISVAAASAVLNGNVNQNIRVGEAARARVRKAAEDLEYKPNRLARSLATGKNGVLGLVFPYSGGFIGQDPFCAQIMTGVFEEVIREKHNIMLHTAAGDDWNAADADNLIDSRIDGLLLVLPMPRSAVIERCRSIGFPYVAIVCEPNDKDVYAVNADEFHGGKIATEHLIQQGHRKIVHLAGQEWIASTAGRCDGYEAAMREAGLTSEIQIVRSAFNREGGYAAMQVVLNLPDEEQPTAIFAANDLCAEGALRALREKGRRVPEDMAIVGYDDTWFTTMVQPNLTSVHMPIAEMGRVATEMLIAQIEGRQVPDRQRILPTRLTVRESSRASDFEP